MLGLTKVTMIIGLALIPHVAFAQDVQCMGEDPDWILTTTGDIADFTYQRRSEMQIMQDDTAQNAPNVRAMTVVGPRDSAIVVIHRTEGIATVLTQRGETPVILAGRCD